MIGLPTPSLHRESTDSLVHPMFSIEGWAPISSFLNTSNVLRTLIRTA